MGYELSKMELWNFGTYNSYQIIPLSNIMPGSLFDQQSHVMMTGKNGSGKSTLMDLIWIALLPDERLLRLGVVETASPEGKKSVKGVRSTSDYVLGKYLSGEETTISDKAMSPYLRSDGMSAILLTLTHRETGKSISCGRQWWYEKHVLRGEPAFFIGRENFSINGGKYNFMDSQGQPYGNARLFAKGMKAAYDSLVEIPVKGSDYTRMLGEHFGGITNDDIILLMKAANAKAIDNVNHFVRDFILSPPRDQAIDSLMDRIRETTFLAAKIRNTTDMYEKSKTIVEELDKVLENFDTIHTDKVRLKLLEVQDLTSRKESSVGLIKTKKEDLKTCKKQMDLLTSEVLQLTDDEKSLSMRVNSSDTAAKIREIDSQITRLDIDIAQLKGFLEEAKIIAERVGLKLPKDQQGKQDLINQIDCTLEGISKNQKELEEEKIENLMRLKDCHEVRRSKKDELNYLENNKTVFPPDLYEIKVSILKELNLSEKDVMFVGELFMVPPENKEYEKAIKAVFSGVATRLIVNPQYERAADAWLNKYKNKKRIGIQSLKDYSFQKRPFSSSSEESVLSKIVYRDPTESSFHYALREWFQNEFDVSVVAIDEFTRRNHMVVTKEGFVKLSSKYRVKHGEKVEASIGWDTKNKSDDLKKEIIELESRIRKHDEFTVYAKSRFDDFTSKSNLLSKLKESDLRFLNISQLQADLKMMAAEKDAIVKKDTGYKKIQEQWEHVKLKRDQAIKAQGANEERFKSLSTEIKKLEEDVDSGSKFIMSLCQETISRDSSINDLYSPDSLQAALNQLSEEISLSGHAFAHFKKELEIKINTLQSGRKFSSLLSKTQAYKNVHKDNDLQYDLSVLDEKILIGQAEGWKAHLEYIEGTELPSCHEEWHKVYSMKLWEAIRDFLDNHKKSVEKIKEDIEVLNAGIKDMKFEKSYLELYSEPAVSDHRIKDFNRLLDLLEKIFTARFKAMDAKAQSGEIETIIDPFEKFMSEGSKREFATDARNHFMFSIRSIKKGINGNVESLETFKGSSKDAKSGGQTVQLCYVLLSMALAQKFHFNDPIRGKNTLRFIILDEFADKLDNEKPEGIVRLFSDMGFQAVLLTPYSKVDLLRPLMNKVLSVIKNPDTQFSKVAEINIDNLTDDEKEALIDDEESETAGT